MKWEASCSLLISEQLIGHLNSIYVLMQIDPHMNLKGAHTIYNKAFLPTNDRLFFSEFSALELLRS